ncbi:hypothetical protein XNA1_2900020 [Xenorhabdus nematophila str. Anatoliense]|nr:hypothetical protein XNA1_2900020 [Xenorhabdus nematophila str. Anatoliense]
MIKRFWTELDPQKKRWVAIAGGLFVLFAVVTMFSGEPKKEEKRGRQETIKHVLTDKNTREIGIDSLSADVKMVSRENSDLKKELEKVKRELEQTKDTAGKSSDVGREISRLRQDLDRLTQKNMELSKKVETGEAGGKTASSTGDARADVNGTSDGEGQFMEKQDASLALRWNALVETRVELALDDYGDKNPSLERLSRYDWRYYKFDARRLCSLEDYPAILHCRRKGIQLIAEQVETFPLGESAKLLGLSWQQGFYHGKPAVMEKHLNYEKALP